ncbi:Holliday junction branch migration protein RuvA [Clostridium sp. BJN0001]|uniref:Holliday junction branch migration protein RuvA n=1 Tax=Clostridium sp. BJN0001 TaxID=2930219 RepID=UPI001FD576A5|nr:Holliday junction branch migration protein RuvA [Clostridium sp. BJN0001]
MYEYIKGIYAGINEDYVIIECNNIGYRIYTSGITISNLPDLNSQIVLYVEQIVREDFIGLYGFLTKEELNMFNLLRSINGVGAKAALSLLSINKVDSLKSAIVCSDSKYLLKATGIGKKIAARIVLELKDKIDTKDVLRLSKDDTSKINDDTKIKEALGALLSLGYSEKEAKNALKAVNTDDILENIIKNALRALVG